MKKSKSEHLGTRIKKIRSYNGMTQEELASAINKTRSMVSHIERTGEVNFYTFQDIAKVLNLQIDSFDKSYKENEFKLNNVFEESSTKYGLIEQQNLLEQLQNEVVFLKEVIQNQWKLIFELSK